MPILERCHDHLHTINAYHERRGIKMHRGPDGGRVEIESELNVGTRFTVRLPKFQRKRS